MTLTVNSTSVGVTTAHTPPPGGISRVASEQPPIPSTQAAAIVALPWYEQRCIDTFRAYATAKRELQQARGELAVVKDIAEGEYEPTHAVGSLGPWRVS